MRTLYFVAIYLTILIAGYGLLTEIAMSGGSHNLIRDMWLDPVSEIDCGR